MLKIFLFLFCGCVPVIQAEPLINRKSWEFLLGESHAAVKYSRDIRYSGVREMQNPDGRVQEAVSDYDRSLRRTSSEYKLAFIYILRFYQLFISSQDQPSCAFTPTCSQYAKEAIARHGPVIGVIMAADRLQRCHGMGAGYYPLHPVTGKLHDPAEQ